MLCIMDEYTRVFINHKKYYAQPTQGLTCGADRRPTYACVVDREADGEPTPCYHMSWSMSAHSIPS